MAYSPLQALAAGRVLTAAHLNQLKANIEASAVALAEVHTIAQANLEDTDEIHTALLQSTGARYEIEPVQPNIAQTTAVVAYHYLATVINEQIFWRPIPRVDNIYDTPTLERDIAMTEHYNRRYAGTAELSESSMLVQIGNGSPTRFGDDIGLSLTLTASTGQIAFTIDWTDATVTSRKFVLIGGQILENIATVNEFTPNRFSINHKTSTNQDRFRQNLIAAVGLTGPLLFSLTKGASIIASDSSYTSSYNLGSIRLLLATDDNPRRATFRRFYNTGY